MRTPTNYRATASDPLTVAVRWSHDRWEYQIHDGTPDQIASGSAPLVESGPIAGRQTRQWPSRARVLRSAGVRGGRYVHVVD